MKVSIVDLDDLDFRLKCTIDVVMGLHEAMVSGSFAAENYLDALYITYMQLYGLQKELSEWVENAFKERRKEGDAA